MERIVTEQLIDKFKAYLTSEERSAATVEKYVRDVKSLAAFMHGLPISKEAVIASSVTAVSTQHEFISFPPERNTAAVWKI